MPAAFEYAQRNGNKCIIRPGTPQAICDEGENTRIIMRTGWYFIVTAPYEQVRDELFHEQAEEESPLLEVA